MAPIRRLAGLALLCAVALTAGCREIETGEELQTLAGEIPQELPAEAATAPPSSGATAIASDDLVGFPLVGSVFPGLGGRLHSSLCDPASDPYSTCI